jgi:ATP-dependent Lon protease
MQLNPHFLFNTLNAISTLVHKDADAADRMIGRLSELLRYTLESTDAQEVSLRQELDFLERYLEIQKVLGPPPHQAPDADFEPAVGTVTGLAWTADGGELMTIEALLVPGRGKLIVTGQLGDVMRESVDAALSYVRSRAGSIGVADDEFRHSDLHVHFPAGAVPKDGPSAGVAVTLAIASALSRRPVRRDVAMTGEVTLRGRILEVGGTKEKILAAYRSGLREVMLPAVNAEQDLRGLPAEVRTRVTLRAVRTMDEVLALALLPAAEGPAIVVDDDQPARRAASATSD